MSATLVLKRGTGTNAQVESDAFLSDYVHFGTIDDASLEAQQHPIGISDSTAYSAEDWLYLKITKAPVNEVTNIRFWAPLSQPATGIFMYVGTAVASATPSLSSSNVATSLSTNYTDAVTSLLWDQDSSLTSVNDVSHLLVMQVAVSSAGDPSPPSVGNIFDENSVYHYSYDES